MARITSKRPNQNATGEVGQRVPATQSIADGWQSRLLRSDRDHSKATGNVANAIIALETVPEWEGVLSFNQSSLATTATAKPPWVITKFVPYAWTDEDDIRAAAWLQHHGIPVGKEIAAQAIQTVARQNPFHPIRDYLDGLEWDDTPRIDTWLSTYLGAAATPYTGAVGGRFLIGAVARIYQPGCKMDTILIFESPQGKLKSTAVRTLFGDEFFTDELADLKSKDAALGLRGVWGIELSELDSLQHAEVSRIKSFTSRQVDRVRPHYGRRPIEAPRECVFIGTCNATTYLKDETGARRFWPVKTGHIKIDALASDRNQLWAEARERYANGDPWWLENDSLVRLAENEQARRYEPDPWDEAIAAYLASRQTVGVSEILVSCLRKKANTWTQPDQNRVAKSLRALGWERFRDETANSVGGKRVRPWRYRRATK